MSENTYNCKFDQRSDCNVKGQSGHIELIIGPMFSGKTTELIRRLKRYRVAQYGCLIVKYAGDTRYTDNGVATHDRQTLPAISTKTLAPIFSDALTYDVIGIDEGQFAFGDILNLVPVAENVTKLSAICAICYQSAAFTRRKTKENEVEVIGGGDKYVAVCRTCFAAPIPGSPDRLPLRDFNTPVDSKKLVGKKTRRRISEGTWMSSLA
ncbi:hypothetical protein C0Q70_01285 [Pomacea canaliculata]|uniref:Thymidine kinase n=1 Tax=Pomacea canaliculata TaxID=400727 RepID=A0A2T7PZ06_POMCA|nr:hypothetical protein C0Q70_01285 [Pomacea canaliculata]